MTDTITITGLVATAPRHLTTSEGLSITSFRLASAQRRFDRSKQRWVDGETNWYTVTTFRQLAMNAISSIDKGDRVIVTGRLRIRDWESGDRAGTNIDVEADAVGHDLTWGTAKFARTVAATVAGDRTEDAETPEGLERTERLEGSENVGQTDAADAGADPSATEETSGFATAEPEKVAVPF
jgi:single-strand DNA-binding protein